MSYDLFRGPDPRHYGQLKTYDEWWASVLAEKWLHDHITISKPVFVGRMPVRVDLQVEPFCGYSEDYKEFKGWKNPEFSIRFALGLIKPGPYRKTGGPR